MITLASSSNLRYSILDGGRLYLKGRKGAPGSIRIFLSVSTQVAVDLTPKESKAKGMIFILLETSKLSPILRSRWGYHLFQFIPIAEYSSWRQDWVPAF